MKKKVLIVAILLMQASLGIVLFGSDAFKEMPAIAMVKIFSLGLLTGVLAMLLKSLFKERKAV